MGLSLAYQDRKLAGIQDGAYTVKPGFGHSAARRVFLYHKVLHQTKMGFKMDPVKHTRLRSGYCSSRATNRIPG